MIVGLNSLEEDDRKVAIFSRSSFSVIALEESEGCSFSLRIRRSAKEADRSPWSRKPRGVHPCLAALCHHYLNLEFLCLTIG